MQLIAIIYIFQKGCHVKCLQIFILEVSFQAHHVKPEIY